MSKNFPEKKFMELAISLARKSEGKTHPNPCVGAVIVKNGRIVGRGFYSGFGKDHAEVEAIKDAGSRSRGADLYVTLEPCQIYGKTPPCTKAIIESGIKRVITGVRDPNPEVSGGGVEELRKNKIEVYENFMENECLNVDKPYHIFYRKKRPYIHLKWAQSLDGVTALPDGGYLSSEKVLKRVHRQRFISDAILVTSGTIKRDRPKLNIRLFKKNKKILRVVLDVKGVDSFPEEFLKTAEKDGEIIILRPSSLKSIVSRIEGENIKTLFFKSSRDYKEMIYELLKYLRERMIISLYVEAVGNLSAVLIEENLVDRISVDVSLMLLGKGNAPPPLGFPLSKKVDFSDCRMEKAGRDVIFSLEVDGKCLLE